MADQQNRITKFKYITMTKATCVPKIKRLFEVCLTTRHTLKGFRSKRQYLSFAEERVALSARGLIALILIGRCQITSSLSKTDTSRRRAARGIPKVSV